MVLDHVATYRKLRPRNSVTAELKEAGFSLKQLMEAGVFVEAPSSEASGLHAGLHPLVSYALFRSGEFAAVRSS